jgi:hypothetical protein
MDSEKLVEERKEAGAEFVQKMDKHFHLRVALWAYSGETARWNLYIASDQITDQNFDVAYGEVLRVAAEMNSPIFDPFEVKIIFMDDPLAKFVVDLNQRHPLRTGTWFRTGNLTGLDVDEGYIYPLQPSVVAKST